LVRMEKFSHNSSSKDVLVVGDCSKHCLFVCSSSTWSVVCLDEEANHSSRLAPVHLLILELLMYSSKTLQWSVPLHF